MQNARFFSAVPTEAKPLVRFYMDFDGTLTSIAGNTLVFTPFYKNCVGSYLDIYRKKNSGYFHLSSENILTKLHDQNNNPDQLDFEMRPASVSLLKNLLSENNSFTADIHIVSKNIGEYITAILKHHGFTDDELSKLNMHDIASDKQSTVIAVEKSAEQQAKCVFAFDDSENDLTTMWAGCLDTYADENIHVFLVTPEGTCKYQDATDILEYDWHNLPGNILRIIEDKINNRPESSSTPKAGI